MKTNPGYESLAGVLQRALDQAQHGKGAERHANSLPFHQQPMQTIARAHGVGFLTGQASKKGEECHGLPHGAKIAELLGAINYLAGAVIFLEGQAKPQEPVATNDNQAAPSAPIVQMKRLAELGEGGLSMLQRNVEAELLRIKADRMQGKHHG